MKIILNANYSYTINNSNQDTQVVKKEAIKTLFTEILKEKGTLIVPSEYFFPGVDISDYQHAHECIRMSIAANEDTLTKGIAVIGEVVRELYDKAK